MRSSRRGTSQRLTVPMQPRRTEPDTSCSIEATSARRDSISCWMRRARSTTTSPSWVIAPVVRSTRTAPSSRSSRATWVDTFDWTVWRRRAAAENDPASATAAIAASWRRSIAVDDGTHRQQLFDESLVLAHNHSYSGWQHRYPPPSRPAQQSAAVGSPLRLCSTCQGADRSTRGRLLSFSGSKPACGGGGGPPHPRPAPRGRVGGG